MSKFDKEIKKLEKKVKADMGMEAVLTRKELPVRKDMNEALDKMGKGLTPTGMKYAGSVNIFLYVSNSNIGQVGGSLATATNFTGDVPLSLAAVRAMLDNARIDIIAHYTGAYEKHKDGTSSLVKAP